MAKSVDRKESNVSISKALGSSRLKELRRKSSLTQADFARRLDISVRGYAYYDRGQRELPQSTRLAILSKFEVDPLPSEILLDALKNGPFSERPTERKGNQQGSSFWTNLRAECRADRERNYSKAGQFMLRLRDQLNVAATTYFTLKNLAISASIPFGFEVNGIDWVLLVSFLLITMFFVSIVSEIPAAKIVRHFRGQD